MAIDTAQKRFSIWHHKIFVQVPYPGENEIDLGDRSHFNGLYSGFLPVNDDFLQGESKRSRIDNMVLRRGQTYKLNEVSDVANRTTGEHTIVNSQNVRLMRVRTGDNQTGKDRRFLTTYYAFGKTVPLRQMRFKRNGLEHEIVKAIEQGKNAYLIDTETR